MSNFFSSQFQFCQNKKQISKICPPPTKFTRPEQKNSKKILLKINVIKTGKIDLKTFFKPLHKKTPTQKI